MKKCLSVISALVILAGCSGKQAQQSEQERQVRQDSLQRVLDSMTSEEALREAEQVRLDSIRKDSIIAAKNAEEERLERGKLHFNDVIKYDKSEGYWVKDFNSLKKILASKGYIQTEHKREYVTDTSWGDYWEEKWVYVFYKNKEKKSEPLYKVLFYDHNCGVEITILDKDLLNEFKSELKNKNLALRPDGFEDEWKIVDYEGNKIWLSFCGD